jgi:pSer/pThr/pTyr-binding forkhead associated (FHA) protein
MLQREAHLVITVRIEVTAGPHAGESVEAAAGTPLRIGRAATAGYALPSDRRLSALHFELDFDGRRCLVRDLASSNGTFLEGRAVREDELSSGASITAGDSVFQVTVEDEAATRNRVIQALARRQSLYCVLDAARTPDVLPLLDGVPESFQSLYSGESAAQLGACAPYLVQLPGQSRLLRKLVRRGWGGAWGIYLVSPEPFDAIRKHLRRFLQAQDENGGRYYFRFYDPRVLRVFLPSCAPEQGAKFFGPVSAYFAETGDGFGCREYRFDTEQNRVVVAPLARP